MLAIGEGHNSKPYGGGHTTKGIESNGWNNFRKP